MYNGPQWEDINVIPEYLVSPAFMPPGSCIPPPQDWTLYPGQFLIQLQNIFLGLVSSGSPEPVEEEKAASAEDTDEDVDGVPLDGAAMLKAAGAGAVRRESRDSDGDSLDGAPIGEPEKTKAPAGKASGFVTSKWETVDPEEVKKGVVTTSKWEQEDTTELLKAKKALMGSVASKWDEREEDIDGEPLGGDSDSGELPELDTRVTEERRALLRDVEVKVMHYQDELESGRKGVKSGWTISEQVEHHRRKVMKKATEDTPRRGRSPSESPERKPERSSRKKKRRKTRSSSRSRSRTPEKEKKREKRRRSPTSSPSPERGSKRGRDRSKSRSRSQKRSKRSRSRSPKKHKKKSRH